MSILKRRDKYRNSIVFSLFLSSLIRTTQHVLSEQKIIEFHLNQLNIGISNNGISKCGPPFLYRSSKLTRHVRFKRYLIKQSWMFKIWKNWFLWRKPCRVYIQGYSQSMIIQRRLQIMFSVVFQKFTAPSNSKLVSNSVKSLNKLI